MVKATEIANIVRTCGEVEFGEMCIQLGIHASTLYGRIKYLEARFPDIKYDRGVFTVKLEEAKE
jgi:hypothetical protein